MADPRSILYQDVDQTQNKFSDKPKTATQYYIFPNLHIVRIYVREREERMLFNVSDKSMKLIEQFTMTVPGGKSMRLRRKIKEPRFKPRLDWINMEEANR